MQLIIVDAASKFNIEPKRVGEWRSVAEKFNTVKVNRKWLDGRGRDCLDVELEGEVACWVYSMRQKMLHVSRKMIMFKAKKIFDDKATDPALMLSLQAEGDVEKLWGVIDSSYGETQQLREKILHI